MQYLLLLNFSLYFLLHFLVSCYLSYTIRKSNSMATQRYEEEGSWSSDERPMSEFTPVSSSDEELNSEPDFDELAHTGPLAPPPPPEDPLYEGPFNSLQAAYNWCQDWAAPRGYALRKNQIKRRNDLPIRQYFDCNKGGKTVTTKVPDLLRKRPDTASKKTECVFRLAATR